MLLSFINPRNIAATQREKEEEQDQVLERAIDRAFSWKDSKL